MEAKYHNPNPKYTKTYGSIERAKVAAQVEGYRQGNNN